MTEQNIKKRYWLIEQPDLDDDDDYKIVHTTDLNLYPGCKILGEYLKADTVSAAVREAITGLEWLDAPHDVDTSTKQRADYWANQFKNAQASAIKALAALRGLGE